MIDICSKGFRIKGFQIAVQKVRQIHGRRQGDTDGMDIPAANHSLYVGGRVIGIFPEEFPGVHDIRAM